MSNVAEGTRSDEHSDDDEEESTPSTSGSGYVADSDTYNTSSESTPGSDQSIEETVTSVDQTAENGVGAESNSSSTRIEQEPSSSGVNVFPPLLSTLNSNGQPRYDFNETRENERLQFHMLPSERPQLLRTVEEDRVRLTSIEGRNSGDGEEDNNRRCSCSTN